MKFRFLHCQFINERLSDNSETDEQHKGRESQDLSASPSYGMSHPGIALPMMHYVASSQLGLGNAQTANPYPDPYYRSIFAPCDTQPYPWQPYAPQTMLMGIQQAGLLCLLTQLRSLSLSMQNNIMASCGDDNHVQRQGQNINLLNLERSCTKSVQLSSHQEEDTITILPYNILVVVVENLLNVFEIRDKGTQRQKQPPYLHKSRHLHAMKRAIGMGGRFQKKNENQQRDVESSDKSQAHFNQNRDNDDLGSSESAS
ncbi:UNVERIFIED_CONTAM: Nuclear transcription factor Y subunit A-7 [Sesamum radiatum]|uniref:Nuclear transcription factor Y subunit n=1 Tax=Sesamum radiatum TaxID=300843 RepID=A0AAW2LRT4_SESRA